MSPPNACSRVKRRLRLLSCCSWSGREESRHAERRGHRPGCCRPVAAALAADARASCAVRPARTIDPRRESLAALLPRIVQSADHVALAQLLLRATVQLHQIDVIGAQPFETALDAHQQRCRPPIANAGIVGMPAFGEQVKVLAPASHGLSDQFLALEITLGGVDDIESGVEGAVKQVGDCLRCRLLEADLSAAAIIQPAARPATCRKWRCRALPTTRGCYLYRCE